MLYCKVSVDLKNEITNSLFTYIVPPQYEFLGEELVGVRVLVEFGALKLLGFIVEVCDKTEFNGKLKPIFEVLDVVSEVTKEQIELANYISTDTCSLLTQALNLMVPSFLRSKCRKVVNVINYDNLDARLTELFENKTKITLTNKHLLHYSIIQNEIKKGNIEISYDTYSYGVNKKQKEYFVNEEVFNQILNDSILESKILISQKRKDIISFVLSRKYATLNEICDYCNCSNILVRELEKNNVLIAKTKLTKREYNLAKQVASCDDFTIVTSQVVNKYQDSKRDRFLLFTNDDEFKFKFLSKAITNEVKVGKKVFIVTPTITSYTKTLRMLYKYIGNLRVLNFSSRLSNDEYYQNYQTLKTNDYDVVITSKIGLFLPVNNCGLFVMIDSDNYNYINEQTPKYDSHNVIDYRAKLHNAKAIYVSNCPLITDYYKTTLNKYTLLKYIVSSTKSQVSLIDQRMYDSIFSNEVLESISSSLSKNKKVCVITNHSGYATSLICRGCGEVVKCSKCQTPLTYYNEKNVLMCSHCGAKYEFSKICNKCRSNKVELYGTGIEKVREYLAISFPKHNVVCVDKETTSNQKNYTDLMVGLEDDKFDIFVGTSLLLDLLSDNYFDTIVLLDSDGLLSHSDYRSNYECHKLVTKVNSFKANKFICGIRVSHYAISTAIENDYHKFYITELEQRRALKNPPFYMYSKLYIGGDYKDMYYYANYFKKVLKSYINDSTILGPTYDYKSRKVKLIIKYNDYEKLKYVIGEVNNKFKDKNLTVNFEKYPR